MLCLIKSIHVFGVDAKRASFIKCNITNQNSSAKLAFIIEAQTDIGWAEPQFELLVIDKCLFEVAHD